MSLPAARTRSRMNPMHVRVADELRRQISTGTLQRGELLPSRRDLANEFGTAVGTIQKAIQELTSDGTVEMRGRWGTFVSRRAEAPDPVRIPERTQASLETFKPVPAQQRGTAPLDIAVLGALNYPDYSFRQGAQWTRELASMVERHAAAIFGEVRFENLLNDDQSLKDVVKAAVRCIESGSNSLIVIYPEESEGALRLAELTNERQIPVVFIGSNRSSYPIYAVCSDDQDAGYQAAYHLIQRGATEITFLASFPSDWVTARLEGARRAAALTNQRNVSVKGLIAEEALGVHRETGDALHEAIAYEFVQSYLKSEKMPTAVLAINDFVAYGLMRAASEIGYQCGRDYIIIGFDDAVRSLEYRLTSLRPPLGEMAQHAVNILSRALKGEVLPTRTCLPSQLVVRRSTSQLLVPQS
jgi:DNA-binding LacI/PurR family transcriptional regulator/DNA-binding transcriptional regulator YhcF (GntR family)